MLRIRDCSVLSCSVSHTLIPAPTQGVIGKESRKNVRRSRGGEACSEVLSSECAMAVVLSTAVVTYARLSKQDELMFNQATLTRVS